MRIHARKRHVLLTVGLLLLLCGCADTAGSNTPPAEPAENGLAIAALFSQENGGFLCNRTVRFSFGENRLDHDLDSAGEWKVSGLPRSGDMTLTLLDQQEQVQGMMTLSLNEGAVIDATTDENGVGHITFRDDTDEIALLFLLKNDGSILCSLRLS